MTRSKREQLIETAFDQFYPYGIHAVGINQILSASGIAKKTLYTHFQSKEQLIVDVVDYWDNRFVEWLATRLAVADTPLALANGLFDALEDWQQGNEQQLPVYRGCFFVNTAGEFSNPAHQVHQRCAQHKRRVRALLDYYLSDMGIAEAQRSTWCDTLCLLKEGVMSNMHVEQDNQAPETARRIVAELMR
ncbi:TetR/AcrR family transcriptional regulator [Larsenimonas rhizosphaerae]|uniref:TetR/AcrR family transcriptional regulator n=1 Tax=Larsenimonas rhizosphaerae TaxID=2944682 RepID=A0AA41ZCX0_9GAMM|nr:TetR/AcrR family transcriptional regulator [Larsenimonas rhizosphaerae]MCM2130280.1 TetR/AcrR family transcriptional regulator [Larsenimonas rhizosphaerae]MCX2522984.1 TetR/AcrR family transcriptional regulator [Larsenimonas rhizosphaerae]